MNKFFVVSTLVVTWVSYSSCELKVGDYANKDTTCLNGFGAEVCTEEYQPICALLNNNYIRGSNRCYFCSEYGNTDAYILQIGIPSNRPFTCGPLVVGGKPADDPQCANYYRADYEGTSTTACTFESYPICARLANGTLIGGGNKCDFCTRYGQSDATIKALGKECDPALYKWIK